MVSQLFSWLAWNKCLPPSSPCTPSSQPANDVHRKWALTHLYRPLWQGRPFSTRISKNCYNGGNNHTNVCQTDNVMFTLQHQFFCDWNLLQELLTLDVHAWYKVQNQVFKSVCVDMSLLKHFFFLSGTLNSLPSVNAVCHTGCLWKLKFKSLLWIKAALVPLSLICVH